MEMRATMGSNQFGAGMIIVIFLVAIMSIAIFELQRRSQQDLQYQKIEQLKVVRDKLYRRVSSLSKTEEAVYASIRKDSFKQDNVALINCLQNSTCPTIGPGNKQRFILVQPSGETAVSGTPAKPQRYDEMGNSCNDLCNFEVRTYFWAGCEDPASVCSQITHIHVLPQVTYMPTDKNSVHLANVPTDSEILTSAADQANSMRIVDILKFQQRCPPGARLVEFSSSKELVCECLGGSKNQVGINAEGQPICKAITCDDPNKTFAGFDDQWQPICLVRDREFHCFRKKFNMNTLTVNCGVDSYGQPIRIRGIYNTKAGCGVARNNEVVCEQQEAVCCVRVPEPN